MKKIVFFLLYIMFLISGCVEKRIILTDNSLFDPKQSLTSEEIEIFNDVKWDLQERTLRTQSPASAKSNAVLLSSENINKMELYTIPYSEFDAEAFFKGDTTFERILTCCVPPKDKKMFLGKMNGKIITMFLARKKRHWIVENLYSDADFIEKTLSWIPLKIAYPDTTHCKLVKIYGSTYLAYTQNHDTKYYQFWTGQEESYDNEILDYIIDLHNSAEGLRKFFDAAKGKAIKGDSLVPAEEFFKNK